MPAGAPLAGSPCAMRGLYHAGAPPTQAQTQGRGPNVVCPANRDWEQLLERCTYRVPPESWLLINASRMWSTDRCVKSLTARLEASATASAIFGHVKTETEPVPEAATVCW